MSAESAPACASASAKHNAAYGIEDFNSGRGSSDSQSAQAFMPAKREALQETFKAAVPADAGIKMRIILRDREFSQSA